MHDDLKRNDNPLDHLHFPPIETAYKNALATAACRRLAVAILGLEDLDAASLRTLRTEDVPVAVEVRDDGVVEVRLTEFPFEGEAPSLEVGLHLEDKRPPPRPESGDAPAGADGF